MNPGDKSELARVIETTRVIIGGETVSQDVDIGYIVQAVPGPRVPGAEKISLVIERGPDGGKSWTWNAPLEDFDAGVTDDDPANEARWVLDG